MFGRNILTNIDPSQSSRIYNPSTFNVNIVNELKSPYEDLATWQNRSITKISNIVSCEIQNNITPSMLENNRDVFHQSNLSYDEYVESTILKEMRQSDPKLLDKIYHYQQRFDGIAFKPLQEFFASNQPKFPGHCNDILSKEQQLLYHLKSLKTAPNTCMVFESRHLLQNTQSVVLSSNNNIQQDEEEEDADNDYKEKIYEYESGLSDNNNGWSSSTQAQSLPHWYQPLGAQEIHDQEKLERCVYGYINQHAGDCRNLYNSMPPEIINLCITMTYGVIHTIEQLMRLYVPKLDIEPFTYKHYEAQHKGDRIELCQVEGSNIPNCVIASKLNLYSILNSVHSMHNFMNTLNFLYIKYHELVMIYFYVTAFDGKSYGTRLTAENITITVPHLFEENDIRINLENFESVRDPTLEQYKAVLFKEEIKTEYSLLNSFHKEIQDVVDEYNANKINYYKLLVLHDILEIFAHGRVNKEYFLDVDNRSKFVVLMVDNGVSTAVANTFWYRLGGVTAIDNNVWVIEENMNIESELEADLCFIQRQFEQDNQRDEDEEDQKEQKEMEDATVDSRLEADCYYNLEYPPWSEYEDDVDGKTKKDLLQFDDIEKQLTYIWQANITVMQDLDGYLQDNNYQDDMVVDDDEYYRFEDPPECDSNKN